MRILNLPYFLWNHNVIFQNIYVEHNAPPSSWGLAVLSGTMTYFSFFIFPRLESIKNFNIGNVIGWLPIVRDAM